MLIKPSRNNNHKLKKPKKQTKPKTQPKTQTPQSLGELFYPTTTKERKKLIENLFFCIFMDYFFVL
jgi:hypothetical protein